MATDETALCPLCRKTVTKLVRGKPVQCAPCARAKDAAKKREERRSARLEERPTQARPKRERKEMSEKERTKLNDAQDALNLALDKRTPPEGLNMAMLAQRRMRGALFSEW